MSALGHFLEEEGIATTIVSLIRVHSEKTRPPRTLWVPFELGRPLGAPGQPDVQKQVLKAALDLLARDDGPCIIEDFDYDGEVIERMQDWQNPAAGMAVAVDAKDMESARAAVHAEVKALQPLFDQAVAESGQNPVGVSGMALEQMVDHITAFLGDPPESPREGMSSGLLMRYAADDLKAFYLQAASAGPGHPSSVQLTDWYWQDTAAGNVMIALRAKWLGSDNKSLDMVCGRFLVPHMQVYGLGL